MKQISDFLGAPWVIQPQLFHFHQTNESLEDGPIIPIVPLPYEAMHDLLDLTSELGGWNSGSSKSLTMKIGWPCFFHLFFKWHQDDAPSINRPFFSISFQMEPGIKRPFFSSFFEWKEKKRFGGRDKLINSSKLSVKHKPRKLRSMRPGSKFVHCSPGEESLLPTSHFSLFSPLTNQHATSPVLTRSQHFTCKSLKTFATGASEGSHEVLIFEAQRCRTVPWLVECVKMKKHEKKQEQQ